MTRSWITRLGSFLFWVAGVPAAGYFLFPEAGTAQNPTDLSLEAAESAAAKARIIQEADAARLPFGTLRFTAAEANSYLYYELMPFYPVGVSQVRLQFMPNRPVGFVEVDFDKMKQVFNRPPNPVVEYFLHGVHTLGVEGTFYSADGMGEFRLERLTLDGYALPAVVVDFLIEHYWKARYPNAALGRPFRLPYSIEHVVVETGSVVASKPARPE